MNNSNLKKFIRYTTGNVMGMLGLSCYILADTFFISKGLGAAGLTALNLAIPVYSFVHGSGLMLGMGGAAKYSVCRGLKDDVEAERSFNCTVRLAACLAAVFVLIGLFMPVQLTKLLGADEEVFVMTKTYLQIILLFAPAFLYNDVFLCFVRNDENPGLAMTAMLAGSFSNILLDYIFIFPLQLGIFGAVLATGLAPIISMGVLSRHLLRKQNRFHLRKDNKCLVQTATVISLGLPSLIAEVASGIVMIVFNILILKIQGNIGVAAYGIIANLSLVVASVCTGVAQGMQPLISSAYGRGERETMKQILGYAAGTVIGLSVLIYLILLLFAEPIVHAFNSENDLILQQNALTGLRIYFLAIPFMGYNIVLSMFFSSVEKAIPAQIMSLLRGMILLLPMAFVMTFVARMTGIWLTVLLTEGLVTLLGIFFSWKYLKPMLS